MNAGSLFTSKLQSCLNVRPQDLFVSICTSYFINLHLILVWRPHCVVLINMETVPAGLTSHRDRHPGHGIGQSCWNRVSRYVVSFCLSWLVSYYSLERFFRADTVSIHNLLPSPAPVIQVEWKEKRVRILVRLGKVKDLKFDKKYDTVWHGSPTW